MTLFTAIDNDKNIKKLLRIRLLDFLIFLVKRGDIQHLQNHRKILLNELCLVNIQAYSLQM